MAFDQSTTKTGWAVFEHNQYVCHGVLDYHKVKNVSERFFLMAHEIFQIIKTNSPQRVVMEDVVLQRSPATMKQLSQLQGMIMGFCDGEGIEYQILYPTSWRKQLGFTQGGGTKRSQLKQQAQDLVKEKYGIETTDDEADAICIGLSDIQMEENKC